VIAAVVVLATVAGAALVAGADVSVPTEGEPAATDGTANDTVVTGLDDPPDPPTDRLGWETGRWYNESIAVTPGDGLNDSELSAIVARAAARVEAVRGVEFESVPPVEVVSRADYRRRNAGRGAGVSEAYRLHQNVKYEALFVIDDSTEAIDARESNRNLSVLGYYDYAADRIVIVSENPDAPRMDEITLAQELFHALQDRKYALSRYNRSTIERSNAVNGIVEGDGNYVDYLYDRRCASEWGGCLRPERGDDDGGDGGDGGSEESGEFDVGVYLVSYQPYSDGPAFVRSLRERGGWAAVDEAYAAPPESTEQVIHPEKYGEDPPTAVTVRDRSGDGWRVLELPDGVDHVEFGEAGMAAMIIYPTYLSDGAGGILSSRQFLNYDGDGVDPFDPINYSNRYTAGWDGDRLYPYVTGDSATTNETGYVWKIAWDSPEDATEFRDAYYDLLEYYGAETVGTSENTWLIPDDRQFGDAFHVVTDGDTTVIVNAPSVEELGQVRSGLDLSAAMRTPTPTPTPTETATSTDTETVTPTPTESTTAPMTDDDDPTPTATTSEAGTTDTTPTDDETGTPGQPGMGLLGAVLAIGLGLYVLRRRAR